MEFHINLMPWRQQRYQKLKKQFLIAIILSVFTAIVVIIVIAQFYHWKIDQQIQRNNYIKEKLIYYSAMAKAQENASKEQLALLDQMEMVNQLQNHRFETIYVFDLLPKIIPEGVYLTQMSKENDLLSLYGMTESNTQIAEFMRNIIATGWMQNPILYEITSEGQSDVSDSHYRRFSMTIDIAKLENNKTNQSIKGE
ncbi:PilN domain-containing protein [Thiotrichales bacterium 19X7-9]|nr:PilN domain-containing protein [Thiotrichales bacterium 19X7-9]